jgi:hypothetical protein
VVSGEWLQRFQRFNAMRWQYDMKEAAREI